MKSGGDWFYLYANIAKASDREGASGVSNVRQFKAVLSD